MVKFEILRRPVPRDLPVPYDKQFRVVHQNITVMGSSSLYIHPRMEITDTYLLDASDWSTNDLGIIAEHKGDIIDVNWSLCGTLTSATFKVVFTRQVGRSVYSREMSEWSTRRSA
jgi:hypothetical protein